MNESMADREEPIEFVNAGDNVPEPETCWNATNPTTLPSQKFHNELNDPFSSRETSEDEMEVVAVETVLEEFGSEEEFQGYPKDGEVFDISAMPTFVLQDGRCSLLASMLNNDSEERDEPRERSTVDSRWQTARTRRARGRGFRSPRARGARTATRAVTGPTVWKLGEPMLEVCVTDEDVPPSLRGSVRDSENARRKMRQDSGANVSTNDDDCDASSDDVVARELFGGDSEAMKFEWSPMATFCGRAEEFLPKIAGPTVPVSRPYDAFRFYWDDYIMDHIVQETNRHAIELMSSSARFAREWYETNIHELLILFAFWMMIGVIRMPSIKSCFSVDPLLKTSIFRKLMTEARFWNLNKALHFINKTTQGPNSSTLFLLGPIVEHLNSKFQDAYTLGQKITIDESSTLWKGNLSFRQYIRTKAVRFGIKTFELCESATGYLWSFVIYTGKETSVGPSEIPKSTEIVVQLMKPLLNLGHQLFLDNCFNSPVLARFLKRNKTDCIGTLWEHRKNVPTLIQQATLDPGTCIARHSGDVVVMVFQDKKPVYTISTCHGTESVQVHSKPGKPAHYRPAVIADYTVSMGGLNKKDLMLEPYLVERKKNKKWYIKIFKRLLNVSILNSRILLDRSVQKPVQQLGQQAFRLQLVNEIMTAHLQLVPKPRARESAQCRVTADLPPQRLVPPEHRHFPRRSVTQGEKKTKHGVSIGRQTCRWCWVNDKRRRQTVWICPTCDVPLCLPDCFEKFHT